MKATFEKINGWLISTVSGKHLSRLVTLIFWIALWEVVAVSVARPLLLPTPLAVFSRLFGLFVTAAFWKITLLSLLRVLGGIFFGVLGAVLVAALTSVSTVAERFFKPVITVIKTTPVSSFIILAMLWINRDLLPVFIGSLIVFPVVWSNLHTAWRGVPPIYHDLAAVYRLPLLRRIRRIYIPLAFPYFLSACESSLGLAWKAGIAAEVLSLPLLSVGRQLFESKQYLETTDLFVWTLVVVLMSILIEFLTKELFHLIGTKSHAEERGGNHAEI